MKGLFFTAVTFLIFMAVLTYTYVSVNSNIEKSKMVADKISAQRIYYTWHDVSDDVTKLLNVNLNKNENKLEINDTLPATENIEDILDLYQEFVNQIYTDSTINIDFEDIDGTKINLSDMSPDSLFTIEPMNIIYRYPDYGKKTLFVEVDPSNFSYIKSIDLFLELNESFNTSFKLNPKECPATYCLNFTLNITNGTTDWSYPYTNLDIDFDNWITIDVGTLITAIRIDTGNIDPVHTVIKVDIIKDVIINTSIDMKFNTSDFYINLPSILNVTTLFGRKVDFI